MSTAASYVHGAHDVPLIGETVGAYLGMVAARFSEREALVVPHQAIRWTYGQFDERVTHLAAGMLALGL